MSMMVVWNGSSLKYTTKTFNKKAFSANAIKMSEVRAQLYEVFNIS